MSHTIKDEDNHMLSFKENISLEDFGKALKWYNNLVKMFAGRDALYSEFTKWLIDNEFVNV
jgi:hypothetical protein